MVNISIIMPVFNTGEYLKESIGSILWQSYTEFELICVNDASSDNSLDILREFRQQDDRIVIIHHEVNCGAAISRNDGLKIAKGEYVIFLDSDDYFYQDMLEVSYRHAIENDADVVIFGSETLENGFLKKSGYHFQYIDSAEKKEFFLPRVRHVPWDKLVRKKILLDHAIWFQDIPTNNDVFYSFSTILVSGRIVVCDRYLLKYRYGRFGSLTDIRFSKVNYTVEAFYALFRYCIQNEIEGRLTAVLMNIIADNIQLYLSEESYPLKVRKASLKNLLEHRDMIDALSQYETKNVLYLHNRKFVQKLIQGGEVCNTGYFQYYLEGIEEIIKKRRMYDRKIALWGCGQNGRRLLQLLDDANISVDYVVDENRKIQGEFCGRYKIQAYEEVADKIATVFITNLEYKEVIEGKAIGKEIIYVWR